MKKHMIPVLFIIFQTVLGSGFCRWCLAAEIEYTETLTPIFSRSANGVDWIVNSADGTKLAFVTYTESGIGGNNRLYIMNTDGSNLKDLTSKLIVTDLGPIEAGGISDLQLNKSGSRLFFRAFPSQWLENRIYIFDTSSEDLLSFFINMFAYDDRKSFGISSNGNSVYYRHDDRQGEPWSPGFYKATIPDDLVDPQAGVRYMGLDQLPGTSGIGFCRFLGHAMDADTTLFSWNSDPYQPNRTSLWIIDDTGLYPNPPFNFIPGQVTDNFGYIWGQPNLQNEIISADGTIALAYLENTDLVLVDLQPDPLTPSPLKFLAEGGFSYPHLSPSGRYARFTGSGYCFTRFDLLTDEMSAATKNDGNMINNGQERRGRDSGAPSRSLAGA